MPTFDQVVLGILGLLAVLLIVAGFAVRYYGAKTRRLRAELVAEYGEERVRRFERRNRMV